MKRLIICSLISVLIFFNLSSCKKVAAAIYGGTDITVSEFQFIIPQIYDVPTGEVPIGAYSFYFNLDSTVKANTGGIFGANAVNSIKIKQLTIKIINPDAYDNLGNFDSARVTIQSSSNSTPAELFNIGFPDTYTDIYTNTPVNRPELLSYLKGNIITYILYGKVRAVTNKPLGFSIDVTLRAD